MLAGVRCRVSVEGGSSWHNRWACSRPDGEREAEVRFGGQGARRARLSVLFYYHGWRLDTMYTSEMIAPG